MKKLFVFLSLLIFAIVPKFSFAQSGQRQWDERLLRLELQQARDQFPLLDQYPLLEDRYSVIPHDPKQFDLDPGIILPPKNWDCDPGILLPAINDDIDPGIVFDPSNPYHAHNKVPFIRMPQATQAPSPFSSYPTLESPLQQKNYLYFPHYDLKDFTPHFYLDKGFHQDFPYYFELHR